MSERLSICIRVHFLYSHFAKEPETSMKIITIYIFNLEMEPKVPVKAFSVLFFTFFRPKNYKQIAFKTCT